MAKRAILIIFMTHEEEVTGIAVASLLPQLSKDDTLLLLHNGLDISSFRQKYKHLPQVEYYESDSNLGVAGGRNYLISQPSCQNSDLVFLIDSDAFVPNDYLDLMTTFMDENPDVGIAGPVVLDYPKMKKSIEELGVSRPSDLCGDYHDFDTAAIEKLLNGDLPTEKIDHIGTNPAWRDTYLNNRDAMDVVLKHFKLQPQERFHVGLKFDVRAREQLKKRPGAKSSAIAVTNIAGCCQTFRRHLLDEIGKIYDLYSPYGLEDVDFSVRAILSGKRNVTTNTTYMLHKTDNRHGQRTTPAGHFLKRANDSRTRTIFEYRWDRESFPRNSLRRIIRRNMRLTNEAKGDFNRTREGFIAEVFGVRKALNQLAFEEREAFGDTLTRNISQDPALEPILHLIGAAAATAAGLNGNTTFKEAYSRAEEKLHPKEGGRRLLRFNYQNINSFKRECRGSGRFGNTYPPNKQDVVSDQQRQQLRRFKDLHKGERCFIVGNGPSLKKTDFNLLRNEATFAVNGIFYMYDEIGFTPTYYVVEDNHVVDDNLERIISYPARTKFFPAKFSSAIEGIPSAQLLPTNWEFYYKSSKWFETPRFSRDIDKIIYVGQTVTYLNLQLAHYMGFQEVVLIGVDFSYQVPKSSGIEGFTIISNEDDPNHFHPSYFGKGKKWHFPKLENCEKVYKHSREIYEEDEREVLDATIGGKLDVYKKTDFYKLFEDQLLLNQPNNALIFFIRRILLEALEGGSKPRLALGALPEDDTAKDIEAIATWYKDKKATKISTTKGAAAFDKVIVSSTVPPGKSGISSLLVLCDADLIETDETGRSTPSPMLMNITSRYENVVLHNGFALASNQGMPQFLQRDFGLSTNVREARRPNLTACIAEANEQNMRQSLISCGIYTVYENVFGLPTSNAMPDSKDLSLVKAVLDTMTPVLLKDNRLYFPR